LTIDLEITYWPQYSKQGVLEDKVSVVTITMIHYEFLISFLQGNG
jgi:hypothetical protein